VGQARGGEVHGRVARCFRVFDKGKERGLAVEKRIPTKKFA